jgi:hypothetical protein
MGELMNLQFKWILSNILRVDLPEDGDRIQSPRRCVLKYKKGDIIR